MGIIFIHNVCGSSRFPKPSTGDQSWLAYWERITGVTFEPGKLYHCPACNRVVVRNHLVGCHVQKYGSSDKTWYIIPMCMSCNHISDFFEVEESWLVPIPSNLGQK